MIFIEGAVQEMKEITIDLMETKSNDGDQIHLQRMNELRVIVKKDPVMKNGVVPVRRIILIMVLDMEDHQVEIEIIVIRDIMKVVIVKKDPIRSHIVGMEIEMSSKEDLVKIANSITMMKDTDLIDVIPEMIMTDVKQRGIDMNEVDQEIEMKREVIRMKQFH